MSENAPSILDAAPLPAPPPVLPYGFAKRFGVVITGADAAAVHVGLRRGDDPRVLAEVRRIVARPLTVDIVEPAGFDRLLSGNYALGGFTTAGMEGSDELGLLVDNIPSADDLLDTQDDAPIIRLINGLIAEAARQGVSDIHIEPYEAALIVRMRADGQLTERHRLPANVASMVVSRIKVMARLDIAERRLPQDGRIGLTLGGKSLDVRVSTLPSRAGERVVLRLLDKDNAGIDLDALGMPLTIDRAFRAALAEPNGIVLVTGPTGSGKTTTLYAGLRLLNDGSRNILTVEDPVEYAVDGVGQTQVNPKVGLSFAAGLRAILRQDPDTVMVGEIRDSETAEIAIQASLTGHLVLSSVHTNDSAGAITRLRDMGIEPFLLASTLRAVIAQRLVRRLCADCATPHPADAGTAALIGIAPGTTIWAAHGCPACAGSGYRGRVGVFEAIRITDEIRKLILDGGDEAAIAAQAFAHAPALPGAARALVTAGVTTPEEAVRVMRSGAGDA
ncbi:GspE/PulE family protein [Sandarakinorhabdus sp. DWP1-3-1]|uniref:GspE/PulE family protein n=1 Tax=Sandarakinorhabdus sp. DWP1-3-1 TaxID=2804627 RepID=UPI003CF80E68